MANPVTVNFIVNVLLSCLGKVCDPNRTQATSIAGIVEMVDHMTLFKNLQTINEDRSLKTVSIILLKPFSFSD